MNKLVLILTSFWMRKTTYSKKLSKMPKQAMVSEDKKTLRSKILKLNLAFHIEALLANSEAAPKFYSADLQSSPKNFFSSKSLK